jgi:hypothetical protein
VFGTTCSDHYCQNEIAQSEVGCLKLPSLVAFQQGGKVHRHGSPERTSDLQRTNDSLPE